MAKLLLQAIPKKNRNEYTRKKTHEGWTALHMAAEFQYVDFAYMLIKEGSLVNEKNNDGYTPLHMCAKKNNINMFKLLLQHNANIQSKSYAGKFYYIFIFIHLYIYIYAHLLCQLVFEL